MKKLIAIACFLTFSFSIHAQHEFKEIFDLAGTSVNLAGSQNGKYFATSSTKGRVFIHSITESQRTIEIDDWSGSELIIAMSQGGRYLLVSKGGFTLRIYHVATSELVSEFTFKSMICMSFALSESGVLAISNKSLVRLYNYMGGKKRPKPFTTIDKYSESSPLLGLEFQPGTENLAIGGLGLAVLVNTRTEEELYKFDQIKSASRNKPTALTKLVFDSSGKYLVAGDDYTNSNIDADDRYGVGFNVLDVSNKAELFSYTMGGMKATGMAFSSDLSKIIVSSTSGYTSIYEISTGEPVSFISGFSNTSIVQVGTNEIVVHYPIGSMFGKLNHLVNWNELAWRKAEITSENTLISKDPPREVAKKKTATIRVNEVPTGTKLMANTTKEMTDLESEASQAMASGNFTKAIEVFAKIIEKQPKNLDAHFGTALAYQDSGDPQKAIQFYQKTLQIDPNYLDAQNNIGMIYLLQLEEYEEALDIFMSVADKKPVGQKQIAWGNAAECYAKMGDKVNQKAYYMKALDDDRNYAHGNHRLAFYFYNESDFENATVYWEKAIDADLSMGLYYKNLAATYKKMGKVDEMNRTYADGLVNVVVDKDDGFNLAYAEYLFFDKKDETNAVKYYLSEMDMNPQSDAWIYVSSIYTNKQEWYKVKEALRKAKPYHQYNKDYNYYLGGAEYFSGNQEKGMSLLKKSARAGSEYAKSMLDGNGIQY